MRVFKPVLDYSERILTATCAMLLASMFVLGVMTVFFRFVIQTTITFPAELIRYFFIWVIALGAAVGIRRNMHAAIGVLVRVLPGTLERLALLTASFCTAVFFAVLIDKGYHSVVLASEQVSPILEISMAWVYLAVPVGALIGFVYTVELFVTQLLASSSELVTDDH